MSSIVINGDVTSEKLIQTLGATLISKDEEIEKLKQRLVTLNDDYAALEEHMDFLIEEAMDV